MKLSLTFAERLVLLGLMMLLGLLMAGGLAYVLGRVGDNAMAMARIGAIAQDLFAFIVPAVALALLVTRLPADFLMVKTFPRSEMLLVAVFTLVASQPAVAWINSLCELLPWPQRVLDAEAQAAAATAQVLGPHTVANLVMSLVVVGVFTGLSEELFFRGALQRVLQTRPMSVHLAVWIAAAVFSLMHGQPVGFVARLLLGALFGYAAVWTGSVWTAVILHILNNSMAVAMIWAGADIASAPAYGCVSAALTAAGVYLLYSRSRSRGM